MSHRYEGRFEKKKVKKPLALWQKVLLILLAVILVLAIAAVLGINYVLGRLGRFDDDPIPSDQVSMDDYFETDPTVEGQETIETMRPEDVTFETVDPLNGENIVNILLIGQDARPGEERARSDSMILLTLNRNKNAIQLTSFLRDTYVQIPGWADNKLNVAYRYEGVDLLNEALKVNFGIVVDGNVAVNFEEFTTVIDILGGVDVNVTAEEAEYIHYKFELYHITEGMNHLDGKDALAFSRIRHLTGGDYGRTERQRRLITALVQQVSEIGLSEVLRLVNEVLPNVSTNLTNSEIINYTTAGLMLLADGAEFQTLQIPAQDAHYDTMINGMSVFVPNLEMCREDLEEFIYSAGE